MLMFEWVRASHEWVQVVCMPTLYVLMQEQILVLIFNSIKLYLYSDNKVVAHKALHRAQCLDPLRASTMATGARKKLPVNQEETLSRTASHKGGPILWQKGRGNNKW